MRLLTIDIETLPHEVYAWGLHDQHVAINQMVNVLAGPDATARAKMQAQSEKKVAECVTRASRTQVDCILAARDAAAMMKGAAR